MFEQDDYYFEFKLVDGNSTTTTKIPAENTFSTTLGHFLVFMAASGYQAKTINEAIFDLSDEIKLNSNKQKAKVLSIIPNCS